MRHKYIVLFLCALVFLTGCDYSKQENRHGIFYHMFAHPMDQLLHWIGNLFSQNYGIAIIVMVLMIRLIMLPLMLSQSKHGHRFRKKMAIIKPEIKKLQEKVKQASTQEERMAANQAIMKKYQAYGINPMKTMLGCLPLLIQMPILLGLYSSLKWASNGGIADHPHFLWFNLLQPDIGITIIAGVLYVIQPLISLETMPKEQRGMGYIMVVLSPIVIVFVSLKAHSALGLYWTVNATFLIIQMYFANKYYGKIAEKEAEDLRQKIENPKPSTENHGN